MFTIVSFVLNAMISETKYWWNLTGSKLLKYFQMTVVNEYLSKNIIYLIILFSMNPLIKIANRCFWRNLKKKQHIASKLKCIQKTTYRLNPCKINFLVMFTFWWKTCKIVCFLYCFFLFYINTKYKPTSDLNLSLRKKTKIVFFIYLVTWNSTRWAEILCQNLSQWCKLNITLPYKHNTL